MTPLSNTIFSLGLTGTAAEVAMQLTSRSASVHPMVSAWQGFERLHHAELTDKQTADMDAQASTAGAMPLWQTMGLASEPKVSECEAAQAEIASQKFSGDTIKTMQASMTSGAGVADVVSVLSVAVVPV